MTEDWQDDVLGPDYQSLTLPLADDDEGEVVATLVRHLPVGDEAIRPVRAVLYTHGWSDYFFQTGLAEYWTNQGAAFYALDLRKYGRSLRAHQSAGYIADLDDYDEEIAAALAVIHSELGRAARIMFMGHSTGGLIGVLWAQRHPGTLHGLVLNSPWLELQGSAVARHLSAPAIDRLARFGPKTTLPNIDPGFYSRSLQGPDSEWTINPLWRPTPAFPVRAGWLSAILEGHATVARGLDITTPILTLASSRTLISPRWSEEMRAVDSVLDVELIVRRAVQLGPLVTVARFEGALHDVVLSKPSVRARVYAEISRWTTAYGWG